MKIVLLFLLSISVNIFSQSIMHPGKFGFGYYYAHSIHQNYNVQGHNIFISSGKFDAYFSISKALTEKDSYYSSAAEDEAYAYTFGVNIVSIKEEKKLMPLFSVFSGLINDRFSIGTGPTLAFELYNNNNIRIVPEAVAAVTFYDILGNEIIGEAGLTFGTSLDIAAVTDFFILTLAPGYSAGDDVSFFSVSIGISFTPDNANSDE